MGESRNRRPPSEGEAPLRTRNGAASENAECFMPFASTPAGPNAQIAVIGRRSTERIEPIPNPPFEDRLGGLLWLAQHITSALTAFCAKLHDARRARHERDPENSSDPGLGCGRV